MHLLTHPPSSSLSLSLSHTHTHTQHAQRDSVWWTEYFRNHWANVRPGAPVIVYPEGTRNQKMESLPLKMGCLKVAHTLGVPVQVVITTEKEKIFNEKAGSVALGVRCVVSVSPALKPKDFASLEDFIAAVQAAWEVRGGLSAARRAHPASHTHTHTHTPSLSLTHTLSPTHRRLRGRTPMRARSRRRRCCRTRCCCRAECRGTRQ